MKITEINSFVLPLKIFILFFFFVRDVTGPKRVQLCEDLAPPPQLHTHCLTETLRSPPAYLTKTWTLTDWDGSVTVENVAEQRLWHGSSLRHAKLTAFGRTCPGFGS